MEEDFKSGENFKLGEDFKSGKDFKSREDSKLREHMTAAGNSKLYAVPINTGKVLEIDVTGFPRSQVIWQQWH